VPDAVVAEFGRRAALEARPIDDHRSTAAYRRHAVAVLASRLLARAGAAS
jgi:CO/xanthine dehydrogenase FAD-binding subunit